MLFTLKVHKNGRENNHLDTVTKILSTILNHSLSVMKSSLAFSFSSDNWIYIWIDANLGSNDFILENLLDWNFLLDFKAVCCLKDKRMKIFHVVIQEMSNDNLFHKAFLEIRIRTNDLRSKRLRIDWYCNTVYQIC